MAGNSIIMRIDGHPKPNPRARARAVVQKNGTAFATVYPANTDAGWRECVGIEAKLNRPVTPLMDPVRVDIVFIFPRPKGHYSTGQKGGLTRSAPVYWHTIGRGTYGGDRDNCEKTILDVLTNCGFWKDDGLVCSGQVVKRWAADGERPGALVVLTPLEDKEPSGWLADLDSRRRRKGLAGPAPKTVKVIPDVDKPPSEYRKFSDLWVAKWMTKYMTRYPFAGARDGKAATRIWDACGHDLDFAGKVMDAFLADDQDFYKGHTLAMLSAGGVLPKFLAAARAAKPMPQGQGTIAEFMGMGMGKIGDRT